MTMSGTLDYSSWRLQTDGGIKYKLTDGYPTLNVSEDNARGKEQYVLRSQDVEAFIKESIPAPVVVLGSVIRPRRRHMPGASILITRSIDVAPHNSGMPADPQNADPNAPSGSYAEFCTATISYETKELESGEENDDEDPNDPETFLTHSVTAGGEHMSWPANRTATRDSDLENDYTEVQDNQDVQGPIVKTIPTIEHGLDWKAVLSPNWSKIIQLLGHVNDVTLPLFFNAKKETVMFMGVSGQREYLWNGFSIGVQPWSLNFKFSHREIREGGLSYGWNHIYSPKNGTWRELRRANGRPIYEASNLLELFTIEEEQQP